MKINKNNLNSFYRAGNSQLGYKLNLVVIPSEYSWCTAKSQYWHAIKYDLLENPLCTCGKNLKFLNSNKGYLEYCSNKCRAKITNADPSVIAKKQKTLMKNYGVTSQFALLDGEQLMAKGKKTAKGLVKFYQNDEAKHRFLYIMYSKKEHLVKIGITVNPFTRLKRVGKTFCDIEYVFCEYIVNAGQIEKHLQGYFSKHNKIQKSEVSGRTEFFSAEILNDIKEIVRFLGPTW